MELERARPRRWGRLVTAVVLIGATVVLSPDGASAALPPVQPTFLTTFKPVGIGGYEVATGDVNGDGNLDLAATNQTPDTVSLLLGHRDGAFSDAVDYATGDAPLYVTFGDLNGDGNDDVITGDVGSPAGLSVFLANGDGTLAPRTAYPMSTNVRAVVTSDVNADHHVDVLAATFSGVSLFLGNSDGTLGAPTPVWTVTGGGSISLLLADVNGDRVLDLLTIDPRPDPQGERVEVLLGDGAGGFSLHESIFAGTGFPGGPRSLAVADFTGDRHVDIVAITDYLNGQILLAPGNGDGSFGTRSTFSGGVLPFSVAAGDLNLDGIPDLVIAGSPERPAVLRLGNGDGTFTPFDTDVRGSISALIADFDRDGLSDVAISTRIAFSDFPDKVAVLINTTIRVPVCKRGNGYGDRNHCHQRN